MNLIGHSQLEETILNQSLSTGNEDILDQYNQLQNLSTMSVDNYGPVLKFGLAISDLFNRNGVGNNYFHIGGYATLFHICNLIGVRSFNQWRGSHDLDIVETTYGLESLFCSYFDTEVYKSTSIAHKKKIELKDEDEHKVEVDFYAPDRNKINVNGFQIQNRMLDEIQTVNVMGVDVKVPKIHDLLSMKLGVNCKESKLPRKKDMGDIINLIGCLEFNEDFRSKYSSSKNVGNYLRNKLSNKNPELFEKLKEVVKYAQREELPHILCEPSEKLYKCLEVM